MKKLILLATLTMLQYPLTASAQIFGGPMWCINCASEPTALAQKAQQALQYIRQAQQLRQEIQQVQIMIQEGRALAHSPTTGIIGDLNALSGILISSRGLAGSMAQMDEIFRKVYAPYSSGRLTNYSDAYNGWANTALKTLSGTLSAAGYQGGMLQNEATWMRQIQVMNQTPLGRDQSLQLGNSIATQEIAELQALRQLMLVDIQSKAAYTATEVNREQAAEQASANALMHTDRGADQTSY